MSKEKKRQLLYSLDGNPGVLNMMPYSVQHILAMFVTNIVPIGIVVGAASPALSHKEMMSIMQMAMLSSGIATILQASRIWKIGAKLPIMMGLSFSFTVPLAAIAAKHGFGTVVGSVIIGGIFEGILGLSVKYWKRFMAPVVSAVVVTGIGLSLLSVASRSFGGGYADDFGSRENLIIGGVTMLVCILWMILAKGNIRHISILVGLCSGYIAALIMGKIDYSALADSAVFELPRILPYKPVFRFDCIISICLIYMVSATETLGDTSALVSGAFGREMTREEMMGALTLDGFGSTIGGLLSGFPVTSYSENVGLTIMTKVVNRNVLRLSGLIMIIAGLFPPVSAFFNTIPQSAIGAVLLVVIGQLMVSGFEMISRAGFTMRNKIIVATSLSVGIGFTASSTVEVWNVFPTAVQSIFAQNVVAIIFVLALFLNIVLPKKIGEEN